MTRRLTPERLRALTLRRQFPVLRGRSAASVVELYERVGPIQTQVPRAAHVAVAARLLDTPRAVITDAFESYALVKTTTLRGTVHTSAASALAALDGVSRGPRGRSLRTLLRLERVEPAEIWSAVEAITTGQWVPRKQLLAEVGAWLTTHESPASAALLAGSSGAANHVWGHSGLLRRPPDARWETRTDTLHRAAADVLPAYAPAAPDAAARAAVRIHLSRHGPATRRDIAWWAGAGLTTIDAAVDQLGDEVVRLPGVDGRTYLDLAEPPRGGTADPGTRLLPEFDGLLLGYEGPTRSRFVDDAGLARLWAKVNGLLAPTVLHHDRLVATWQLRASAGRQQVLEVTMLPGCDRLDDSDLAEPATAVAGALDSTVTDIRVLSALP